MGAYDTDTVRKLQDRAGVLRRHVLRMVHAAGSGHVGGSLSAAEMMAVLYFHVLRVDPSRPDWPERDRFVLSKGHACPILYAALAERGFFPVEEILTFRQMNSRLQGHPEMGTLPGVDANAGAEGQGLSVAIGMALAARLDGRSYHTYVMLGDGENDTGQVWEAAMAAGHLKIDNLTAFIDRNGLQQEGPTERIMGLEPLAEKWRAFKWHVVEIDGHHIPSVLEATAEARATKGRPTCNIAHTVKGKGISFMENNPDFHGKAPTDKELEAALRELGGGP
jgi:transketolase